MALPSLFKRAAKGFVYSLTGSWDAHRERIGRIKEQKEASRYRRNALLEDARHNPAGDDREAFLNMCERAGFDEADLAYNRKRYTYEMMISSVLTVALFLYLVYLIIAKGGLLISMMVSASLVLFFIKFMTAWFRHNQIRDQRLYSFKSWLFGH